MKINDLCYNATGGEGKIAKSTVKTSENIIDKAFGKIYDIYFKDDKGVKNEAIKQKK